MGETNPDCGGPSTTRLLERATVDHAWLGLACRPDGARLYSAGADQSTVTEFEYDAGRLKQARTFVLAPPFKTGSFDSVAGHEFIGGLAVSPDGKTLFAAHVLGTAVSAIDLESGDVIKMIELPAEPYTSVVSSDGKTLYVSLWGGSKVLLFDTATLAPQGEIPVGGHPNAMAFSQDGGRLFVACANTTRFG